MYDVSITHSQVLDIMHKVTISSKYRITIPKETRERLGIRPGQKVDVTAHGAGIRMEFPEMSELHERMAKRGD